MGLRTPPDFVGRRAGRRATDTGGHLPGQRDRQPGRVGRRQRRRGSDLRRACRGRRGVRGPAGRSRRRSRSKGRGADPVRNHRALRRHFGCAVRRRGLRSRRRRRPGRAGSAGVRRGAGAGGRRQRPGHRRSRDAGPHCRAWQRRDLEPAHPGRRCLDHLHLRIDRHSQGRRGDPPQRCRVRRRRVAAVPATPRRADRTGRPSDGRPVGGLRCELRGDLAGLGQRCLPGAGAAVAGPQRCRRRSLARRQRHHRRLHRPDAGGAVAANGVVPGATVDHGRRGLPGRAGQPAAGSRPRGLEHLRSDRSDRGGLRRAARRHRADPDRAAAGGLGSGRGRWRRCTGGRGRVRRVDHQWRWAGPLSGSGQGCREVRPDAHPGLAPRLPVRRSGPQRPGRADLPRPGRRPDQAGWPPDRAR